VLAIAREKEDLVTQSSSLVEPSTPEENSALSNVCALLDAQRLLPSVFGSEQALIAETRLLHDFLDNVSQARSYYQLLQAQAAPTGLTETEMQSLEVDFRLSSPVTQDAQDSATMKIRIKLLDKKLQRAQTALSRDDYTYRLLERDPQWQQRTIRNHGLPSPQY